MAIAHYVPKIRPHVNPGKLPWDLDRAVSMRLAGAKFLDIAEHFGLPESTCRGRIMSGFRRVADHTDKVEVPKWVPLDLKREYCRLAIEFGEDVAASWARSETGKTKPLKWVTRAELEKGRRIYLRPIGPEMPGLGQMSIAEERRLIECVCQINDMPFSRICGRVRDKETVKVRAIIAHILRNGGRSTPYIGRVMGGRDHTTILNLLKAYTADGEKVRG